MWKFFANIIESSNGIPVEQAFTDGNGNPYYGYNILFPILQKDERGVFRSLGTGFFISNNGFFCTAKHVLCDDKTGNIKKSLFGIQIEREKSTFLLREIINTTFHKTSDLAVGFLKDKNFLEKGVQKTNKYFELTSIVPPQNGKIATVSFPLSNQEYSANKFLMQFKTISSVGVVDKYFENGRDKVTLPGKCFQTTLQSVPGASGGPAFYNGCVFGIISTGIQMENNQTKICYVSSILDILELELENRQPPNGAIQKKINLREIAERGLIQIKGISS